MKEWLAKDQETPLYASHWSAGIGQPAGIYWLDGQCIIAGYGTRAEAWVLGRGAIEVGTVRFDRPSTETMIAGAHVTAVPPQALAEVPPPRN